VPRSVVDPLAFATKSGAQESKISFFKNSLVYPVKLICAKFAESSDFSNTILNRKKSSRVGSRGIFMLSTV